jgi:LuxR family maltose regulon positive regulatory protein
LPPEPQLALKVTPPRIPRTVLERPRLSSVRPEFADKAVMAVQAAAGFGKTSLLAQWRKEALQEGAVVAWLTLDGRDTDNRLVAGLAAAMRAGSGRPNFGQACLGAAGLDGGSLEGLTQWLAEVADLAAETVLILDEVHALPDATLQQSLAYLLLNAPSNLRIILASRRPVPLPVADLPARGHFVELTAGDLRFDLAETVTLLQKRFGRKIAVDSCVRLHELTEGWPLGLQLAVSTIERSPDLQQAIAGFSTRTGDLHRYFVESLVDHLPPAAAQFLVRVSFVDAVSPALCEAITQQQDCAGTLAQLRELTPIFSEGVEGDWLRIHPLAREFLAARFAQLPESERREYHARAARWLDAHGQCEEAARQMLDAGLVDEAYRVIARALHDVLVRGQVSVVADWIGRLPQAEILRRTSLRLTVGWILAQSDRHAEAAQLVGPIIDDTNADAGDRCESAEICATAAFFADDIDTMGRIVSSWYEALPAQSTMQRLVGVNQLAFMTLYRGAPDHARYSYSQLPPDDVTAGRYTLGWRDWIIGISYLWEGQVDLAARTLRTALAKAEEDSGRRSPIAVTLASALAAAQWDRNEPEDAAALLANRLDVLERRAPPDAIIMGYVTAARVAALAGDEQRALELLDHLHVLGEARRLPRLRIASLGERMRMHALRGRGDMCAVVERTLDAIVAGLGEHPWGLLGPVVDLQVDSARAYAAVARRHWQDALERLGALAPAAERLRRGRDGVQIYLLRALAAARCGKKDDASLLDEALSMARMWGLARILEDTHPDLSRLAEQSPVHAEAVGSHGDGRTEVQPVGKAAGKAPAAPRARPARGSLLSPRERDVLRLLATGLSNKQIALAMDVTDETIKWHFKNLFRKLNAGSRSHLLHRARMVGVIDEAG